MYKRVGHIPSALLFLLVIGSVGWIGTSIEKHKDKNTVMLYCDYKDIATGKLIIHNDRKLFHCPERVKTNMIYLHSEQRIDNLIKHPHWEDLVDYPGEIEFCELCMTDTAISHYKDSLKYYKRIGRKPIPHKKTKEEIRQEEAEFLKDFFEK